MSLKQLSVCVFLVLSLTVPAQGVTAAQADSTQRLTVAADGSAEFRTIGSALAVADDGDTVEVRPGVYRERVRVADDVTLVAEMQGGSPRL